MQTIQLDNAEFLPCVCELINEGHTVSIRAKGNSMRPFVESDRDVAVLAHSDGYKTGDVVLAEIAKGRFVLHRIDRIDGRDVTLRGDGNVAGTESCTLDDLRAITVQFIRNGRTWNLQTSKVWKVYSRLWVGLLPVRRYLLALYRLLWRHELPVRIRRIFKGK